MQQAHYRGANLPRMGARTAIIHAKRYLRLLGPSRRRYHGCIHGNHCPLILPSAVNRSTCMFGSDIVIDRCFANKYVGFLASRLSRGLGLVSVPPLATVTWDHHQEWPSQKRPNYVRGC